METANPSAGEKKNGICNVLEQSANRFSEIAKGLCGSVTGPGPVAPRAGCSCLAPAWWMSGVPRWVWGCVLHTLGPALQELDVPTCLSVRDAVTSSARNLASVSLQFANKFVWILAIV